MAVTREQVAELVMKVFDRLEEEEFKGCVVEDAVILVELSDQEDKIDLGGRLVPATVILLECTSDRATVQAGIMDFAQKAMFQEGGEEDD